METVSDRYHYQLTELAGELVNPERFSAQSVAITSVKHLVEFVPVAIEDKTYVFARFPERLRMPHETTLQRMHRQGRVE